MINDLTIRGWIGRIRLVAALFAMTCQTAQPATVAAKIDWRAEAYLRDDPDQPVVAAIVAKPGQAASLARDLGLESYGVFDYIDTVVTRVAAGKYLEWQDRDEILLIDPIDNSLSRRVTDLLTQLYRVILYDDLGSYQPAVLNLSLGVPRQLIGKGLSAERVVHSAIELIIDRQGIPVVMSAGNDGPQPGLINPWALARGVYIVGAADEKGTHLWAQSSRFLPGASVDRAFFVAHGENSVGALPLGQPKTPAEIEAERNIDLAGIVGAENVDYYSVLSGTSFAAASLSRAICLLHQAIAALRARAAATTPVGVEFAIDPFIRAYIDLGFDRTHPAFTNRLVDDRKHFGSLTIELEPAQKQQFVDMFLTNGIDIRLRYTPDAVERFLRRAARPIGAMDADLVGAGFVSWDTVAALLTSLRMSELVEIFAEPGEPQRDVWRAALTASGDPLVFDSGDIRRFNQYCQNYDLILGLRLSGPVR